MFLIKNLSIPARKTQLLLVLPFLMLLVLVTLSACSPSLNWREVHSSDALFSVLLPAKPASHERPVKLGALPVTMQMTAAEVDELNFAVASASIDDEQQRKAALAFMQQAMVQNIRGSITEQKAVTLKDGTHMTEIHATGVTANGRRIALWARFGIKAAIVYQVVAMGPQDKLTGEIADTFLSSFALN